MCGESRMHGAERGKIRRLFQRITYRYLPPKARASSSSIFVPFTTQELFQGGEALYYGLNALSNNMIMVDRKQLKNPNGLILGTPGSGKSFSAKREMTNAFLITEDDIIVPLQHEGQQALQTA